MSCIFDYNPCKYNEEGRCEFGYMGSGYPYDAPCFGRDFDEDEDDKKKTNREAMKEQVSDSYLESICCSYLAPKGCDSMTKCPLAEACENDKGGSFSRAFKKWLDEEAK